MFTYRIPNVSNYNKSSLQLVYQGFINSLKTRAIETAQEIGISGNVDVVCWSTYSYGSVENLHFRQGTQIKLISNAITIIESRYQDFITKLRTFFTQEELFNLYKVKIGSYSEYANISPYKIGTTNVFSFSINVKEKEFIDLGNEIITGAREKSNFNEIANSEVLFQNSVKQKLLKEIKISPSGNIEILSSGFVTGGVLAVTGFKNIVDEQIFRKATNDILNVFNEAVDSTGKYKLSINSTNKAVLGSKTVAELGKIRISKGLITGTGALLTKLGFVALAGYLVLNPDVYQNAVKDFYKHSLQLGIELGIQAKTLGDAIKEAVGTGQEKIVITESEVDIDEYNSEITKYWEKQWLDYYGQAYDPNNPSPPKIDEKPNYEAESTEALKKQAEQYQAINDYYQAKKELEQQFYEAAKNALNFDKTIKEYESLKISNGEKAVIDDLVKRELQKRVEFVETATGIYAGGQRVQGAIDGEGNLTVGGERTGVKITPEGIYMSGDSGTGTGEVSGQVDLVVPEGSKVQIDADAFIQALANNKVKFDTTGLETALAQPTGKVQFNTDPFAQFITDNKLKIDNTGLQEILDSKSIQVEGGISVNWGTAPKLAIEQGAKVGLEETSLTGINTIAEKIVARDVRETELHTDKKAIYADQKTLLSNDVKMKDTKNKIAEKEEVITALKAKAMAQSINGQAYDERVATEYTNLHSQASFQTAEGVIVKEGLYSNPKLSTQRVYNDVMLSEGELEANKKFIDDFIPMFKENIAKDEKKLYKFKDVSVNNRVELDGIIAKIIRDGGVQQ